MAYWFVAHEEATGTALLGIMAAALVLCGGVTPFRRRARRANSRATIPAKPLRQRVSGEDPRNLHDQQPLADPHRAVHARAANGDVVVAAARGFAGLVGMLLCFLAGSAQRARGVRGSVVPMRRMKSTSAPNPKSQATKPFGDRADVRERESAGVEALRRVAARSNQSQVTRDIVDVTCAQDVGSESRHDARPHSDGLGNLQRRGGVQRRRDVLRSHRRAVPCRTVALRAVRSKERAPSRRVAGRDDRKRRIDRHR